VPCSSDAAIRKIPKKWENWDPNDGAALHPLQMKILIRSLLMLKAGSDDAYLTYSTCSLNPIENEAVVHAALKKLNEESGRPGEFELVDCRAKLHPFKTRPGLLRWGVYDSLPRHRRRRFKKDQQKQQEQQTDGELPKDDDDKEVDKQEEHKDATDNQEEQNNQQVEMTFDEWFREYKSVDDIPEERRIRFLSTFFPPEGSDEQIESKYNLSRCIRVFANDQNTSGFFIALFRRNACQTNANKTSEQAANPEKQEEAKQSVQPSAVAPVQSPLKNLIRCDPKDPDIEYITTYYGLTEDFPLDQVFTYSQSMNKLLVVNKGLSDLLYADQSQQLNLIAAGAETFIRNNSKKYVGTECIYRISQNGVYHVYPFMTKRVFRVPLDIFKQMLNSARIEVESMEESQFKTEMQGLTCGCFVIVTEVGDQEEALVLHRHFTHINHMVSDLNLHKMKTCINKEI